MILTFYIQGRADGASTLPSEIGYYEAFTDRMREKLTRLPDMTLNEAIVWCQDQVVGAWEQSKRTIKYLSGAPVPAPPLANTVEQENKIEKPVESNGWNFAGIFSSLKGSRGSSGSFLKVDNRAFTEGEVHADLIRVSVTW
jgi:import inner membrane translocase subunit TIM21